MNKLIEQYSEMYPFSKEQTILKQRADESQAIARAKLEEEAQAHAHAQAQAHAHAQAQMEQAPPIQMSEPVPSLPPPYELSEPTPAPTPTPAPAKPTPPPFRPAMMNLLDSNRLQQEVAQAKARQYASRMKMVRGALLVVAVGCLLYYLMNRNK